MAKQYSKLNKVVEYDHDAVDELAEALNEIKQLEQRCATLRNLVEENRDLHGFVWTTAEGVAIAVHNLEDDHLKNIMTHLVNNGRGVNKAIRGEALKRGFDVPEVIPGVDMYQRAKLIEAELLDRATPGLGF